MAPETVYSPEQLTYSIQSILTSWRTDNPRAGTLPRKVRRQINLAIREDNRLQALAYERARLGIETMIREHQHNVLTGYRPRANDAHDAWFVRQQQLDRARLAIEQQINAQPGLTTEDRGQAVTALSVAHHAPSVPMLPVFTAARPTGLQALNARVQAAWSRVRTGLTSQADRRRLGQWNQLHRELAENAQPRQQAGAAVDTAHKLGMTPDAGWVSAETYSQQQTRIAQLERTVAQLTANNERLDQTARDFAAELAELTPVPCLPGEAEPVQPPQRPTNKVADLIGTAHPHLAKPAAAQSASTSGQAVANVPAASQGLDL